MLVTNFLLWPYMYSTGHETRSCKGRTLQDPPTPQNCKQLQSFLSLINFLQPFLPDLASKTTLVREHVTNWDWCPLHRSSFLLLGLGMTIILYIQVNNPTLNMNFGKCSINHIWDRVLFDTPGLKIGSSHVYAHIQNNGHSPNQSNQWASANKHRALWACSEFRACTQRILASINNHSNARLFSDLMKFTVVNESLCKQSTYVLFWSKIN